MEKSGWAVMLPKERIAVTLIIAAVVIGMLFLVHALTRLTATHDTDADTGAGMAEAGENGPVIDIVPGEKFVCTAHALHSWDVRIVTRQMRPGEEAETYWVSKDTRKGWPERDITIREHNLPTKK